MEQNDQVSEWAESMRPINDAFATEFRHWLVAQGRSEVGAADLAGHLRRFLDFLSGQARLDVGELEVERLREALYGLVPSEALATPEDLEHQFDALLSFFPFLQATGRLRDAQPFVQLVRKARPEVVEACRDPKRWSAEKAEYLKGRQETEEPGPVNFLGALEALTPPETEEALRPIRREAPKVGRNDPCPCGSGKKYKKCCGG